MVSRFELLALDIDGVLTDGTTVISDDGSEFKRICFRDLDAISQAKRSGMEVILITGEDSPAVDQLAARFGVKQVVRGAKDKLAALISISTERNVPLTDICYIGDSDRDAPALAGCGFGLAPANASRAARAAANRVLTSSGGAGVVAEALDLLWQTSDIDQSKDLQSAIKDILRQSLDAHQRLLEQSSAVLAEVGIVLLRTLRQGGKILLFGNGGSAAEAQHVAAELVGRFARESDPWPALALTTDSSILTAVANDWEFSEIFARQVRALARAGDIVAGISTSGRSPNVLKALEAGRTRRAFTIGFTGAQPGPMDDCSDICFHAPSESTPRIQELSLLAWHSVCEMVEQMMLSDR